VPAEGRISVTRNPSGAAAAWWCETVNGDPSGKATRRRHPGGCARARVALSEHATVLARGRKDRGRHGWAQRTGVLHEFN
jgi:hypothetical protein